MEKQDLQFFKSKLEEEKELLENDLKKIAVQDPNNPEDWNAKGSNINDHDADPNKQADNFEEVENNNAITDKLEEQLKQVNISLKKIEEGSYGICEKCGKEIKKERLEANPSAKTCTECMN